MPVVTTDPETEMAVIYSLHPLKILKINTLEFIHSKEYPIINELEKFSGSSQLVQYEDGYLAMIHKRNYAKHGGKFYIHKFIKFSSDFKIKKISKSFFLEKRQSVEFCGGLAIKNHRLVLSFGSMDKKAKLLEMNLAQVEKLFSEK